MAKLFRALSLNHHWRIPPLFLSLSYPCMYRINPTFGALQHITIMAVINPHINFNGNAEEAFTFYQSVFGGEFTKIIRFKDIASAEFPIPEKEENKLMHIALSIGKNSTLIGNDVPEFMGSVNEMENRSKIAVSVENNQEGEKIFNGLSVGGTVEVPYSTGPYGSSFGMFRDKYGIEWIIEFDPKNIVA